MAEKRVSVRLSATGGREVRAELEGVGEAGKRGFGRLSSEMKAANERLAGFARRVKVGLAAATAAAAAAGVAMVKSALDTIDAHAKLAQSLGTTVSSIQTLERAGELAGVAFSGIEQATKDLTRRLSQAAADTGPAVDALARLGLTAEDLLALPLDERIGAINSAIEAFVPAAERAAIAGQLFGEEGSIAMARIDTATLRQATQDVVDFGVAVSEQDAEQIERTNDALSRLDLIWRGVANQLAIAAAPALEAIAEGLASIARRTGPLGQAIELVFGNLDRLTTYAATFAGFLAGRWVAGMAAAVFSVRGLATALVILRGALIRTGIGALIVGAGELIFQFGKLQKGAGGVGAAFSLMGDVAREVWDRLRRGAGAVGAAIAAPFLDIRADAASGMQGAIESVTAFANAAVNSFEGAYEAIKTIWDLLPAAIGDLTIQAANALVAGMEAMLNGALGALNGILAGINEGFEALGFERRIAIIPEIDVGRIENGFASAATRAAGAAGDAFARAFEDNPLQAPDLGLREIGTEALAAANDYRDLASSLADGLRAPLASWQALKDAVAAGSDEGADALESATTGAQRLETAFVATEQAAAGVAEETRKIDTAIAEATAQAAVVPVPKAPPPPRPKPVLPETVTVPVAPLPRPRPERRVDPAPLPAIARVPRTRPSPTVPTPPPILDRAPPAITESADALDTATDVARRFETALGQAGEAATRTGTATETAATASGAALETAATGWRAVGASLEDYAAKAADLGGAIGQRLVDAFRGAEDAVANFVRTGKLDFRDLVSSLITDLARLATRRFILGPIANALGGVLGGIGGGGGGAGAGLGSLFASILHAGGTVGGPAPMRAVPALAFAGAPRLHDGGKVGLAPDEVPAILQRGERVLSRRETRDYERRAEGPMQVTVNINAQDAESFRRSRTQVASDIARAIQLGRRGM